MSRPPPEVADIVRSVGDAFIERNHKWFRCMHGNNCVLFAGVGERAERYVDCGHTG